MTTDTVLPYSVAGPSNPSSSSNSSSLLDHLTHSLENSGAAKGPGATRGKVKLHTLFSTPRQARELYPFAHVDAYDASTTVRSSPVKATVEHVFVTASYLEEDGPDQGRLIYALECFLYTLPSHGSALLYVSKIDSSGWGPSPVPTHLRPYLGQDKPPSTFSSSSSITRVLTQAFLSYFVSLSHWAPSSNESNVPVIRHVSLHILARAQRAYLFPSSDENKAKRVLSDGALIKWWRSIVSEVVCGVRRRTSTTSRIMDTKSYYLIPGYSQLESHELVPLPPPPPRREAPAETQPSVEQALAEARWVYGHPYSRRGATVKGSDPLPALPLSGPSFDMDSSPLINNDHIATLLPHFPDDPKSRFIAEIARDSHEHNGDASKRTTSSPSRSSTPLTPSKKQKGNGGEVLSAASSPKGKSSRHNSPLMGGSRSNGPSTPLPTSPVKLTSTQKIHMRERAALNMVSPDEFWERMGFRQECCAGNAVGVFVALFTAKERKEDGQREMGRLVSTRLDEVWTQPFSLPHPIIQDMVFKNLLVDACDWSKPEGSRELTKSWDEVVAKNVRRKGNVGKFLGSKEETEENIGKGVIWAEVPLSGPTEEQISEAERKWKEDGAKEELSPPKVTPVTTLSVKRKKKA